MDTIDRHALRRSSGALSKALREWEEDGGRGGTGPLRACLKSTQAQLDQWEQEGKYFDAQARLLRDQVRGTEAMITQRQQEKTRGY